MNFAEYKTKYPGLVGKRFNRLTFIEYIDRRSGQGNFYGVFRCDCGGIKEILIHAVKGGYTKSCGCYNRERTSKMKTTHGLVNHKLYGVWCGILQRCYYESAENYKWYGAIGVTVCNEWRNDFKAFYDWCIFNGWEEGKDVDKDMIGNSKIYSPSTCTITSHLQNNRSKPTILQIEYNGQSKSIGEWADHLGFTYKFLYKRIFTDKWEINKAFTTKPRK